MLEGLFCVLTYIYYIIFRRIKNLWLIIVRGAYSPCKKIIYDGFKEAVENGVNKEMAAILVDEQYGSEILDDAKSNGYVHACPCEKSGQKEFDFELIVSHSLTFLYQLNFYINLLMKISSDRINIQ